MSIGLDVLAVVIVIIAAIVGYKRGFIRSVIRLLGTAACVIVALIVSDMLASPTYNKIVAPRLESALLGRLENFDITTEIKSALNEAGADIPLDNKQLKKALTDAGSIPAAFERAVLSAGGTQSQAEKLRQEAQDFLDNDLGKTIAKRAGVKDHESVGERLQLSAGKVYDIVRAFAAGDDNSKGVHYLVYDVFDGLFTTIIRYILFTVLLLLLELIVSIIFRLAKVFDHLPLVSGANNTLGLVFGILKGMLYVGLIAAICAAIAKSDTVIDTKVFDDSHIFRIFFNLFYK